MLSKNQQEKLKSNWGPLAESMACDAEVRVYDPCSAWECYLYALNPENEDEVECIVKVSKEQPATVERWGLINIASLFNQYGEGVEVDKEYKPRNAADLYKKLNEGLWNQVK